MTGPASPPAETTTLASLRARDEVVDAFVASDPRPELEAVINGALPAGGGSLRVEGVELHLIRALNRVDFGQGPVEVVAFTPEFLFLADVGRSARAGVSVFWQTGRGLGDPGFPDFSSARIRSVRGDTDRQLLYPDVAGELLLGLDPDADPAKVARDLASAGLTDVVLRGASGEARCNPFEEREIAAVLAGSVAGIRFAQPNAIIRAGELVPGWTVRRIV